MAATIIDPLCVGGRELSIHAAPARLMKSGKLRAPLATRSYSTMFKSIRKAWCRSYTTALSLSGFKVGEQFKMQSFWYTQNSGSELYQ